MGDTGLSVLIERAIARTEAAHPVSQQLRSHGGGRKRDGVLDAVESSGFAATRDAIDAMIAALVEILARLIGVDMASRIIDPGTTGRNTDDTPAAP